MVELNIFQSHQLLNQVIGQLAPLHVAVTQGDEKVVALLLKALGEARDRAGRTLLLLAAQKGDQGLAFNLLVGAGAREDVVGGLGLGEAWQEELDRTVVVVVVVELLYCR